MQAARPLHCAGCPAGPACPDERRWIRHPARRL